MAQQLYLSTWLDPKLWLTGLLSRSITALTSIGTQKIILGPGQDQNKAKTI